MPGPWLPALFAATVAYAQSDDDFDIEDDIDIEETEEEEDTSEEEENADADEEDDKDSDEELIDGIDTAPDKEPEEANFELEEDLELGVDVDEEPEEPVGGDTESVFRDTQSRLSKLPSDEEIAGWDAYLREYPESVYRTRIEQRQADLLDGLYTAQVVETTRVAGAMHEEILLSQPISLDGINPRTRFSGGFQWGIPDYASLSADYEHQLRRNLSLHGGLIRRFSGVNLEVGSKWAFLKSTRTQTVVSLASDLHFNLDPTFPGLRNQIGFGRKFGKVDLQLQAGADLSIRSDVNAVDLQDTLDQIIDPSTTSFQTTLLGGASIFYRASERVGLFVETALIAKPLAADRAFDGGALSFHTVSFGLKFFPENKRKPDAQDLEVNFASTVPYAQKWWQFHQGSIAGQVNAYL